VSDIDQHHWSGWPGAFCFKCGADDPREALLHLFEADLNKNDEIFLGTPEEKAALDAAMICPVKGTLHWDHAYREWLFVKVNEDAKALLAARGDRYRAEQAANRERRAARLRLADYPTRNEKILARYRETRNFNAVGREFGIGGERVRQIIARFIRLGRMQAHEVRSRVKGAKPT
jgi:hypothetical protein